MNKIYVVGLGPGAGDQMTVQAKKVLDACPVIIGYTVYIDLVRPLFPEKQFLSTPMRKEADRCKMAFEEVKKGVDVAMVCSGDSGIYGMAGLIYEIGRDYPEIGIGTGGVKEMTERAKEEILASDCLIGASRMLESAACFLEQKKDIKRRDMLSEYRWDFIFSYVKEHEECSRTAVLFSGDIGFYSGAKKLEAALLHSEIDCTVELIPGISSVVYFAAKLGVSWDDAKIVSLHGNETLFIQTVDTNRKTFFLLGGKDAGERLLNALLEYGMGELFLSVGRDLSYEDEKIIRKKAADFQIEEVRGLCTALVENENPAKRRGPHIRDDAFVRGKVPMTKEEVRAVSIARMELTEDAVVYDVGAGTGSVSVEAALSGEQIKVYAIEKNPEAVLLLEKNRRKFRTDGIRIIEGSAPEALVHLEPPTHLFIGGSSGNLKEILTVVKQKNPNVKIVISAISLETVRDVMDAEKEGLLTDMEVTQICASRSRVLGQYHMMTGMNPVYIISAGGKEDGFGNFDHGDLQRKRENSGGVRTYGGISGSK